MNRDTALVAIFGAAAVLVGAGWWLFHRLFGVPRPDPTGSPPMEVDSRFLRDYGGRDRTPDDPT